MKYSEGNENPEGKILWGKSPGENPLGKILRGKSSGENPGKWLPLLGQVSLLPLIPQIMTSVISFSFFFDEHNWRAACTKLRIAGPYDGTYFHSQVNSPFYVGSMILAVMIYFNSYDINLPRQDTINCKKIA